MLQVNSGSGTSIQMFLRGLLSSEWYVHTQGFAPRSSRVGMYYIFRYNSCAYCTEDKAFSVLNIKYFKINTAEFVPGSVY